MPVHVTLYSRAGCCLCEEARAELLAISNGMPLTIAEIDITTDPALERTMFDRIPVIKLGELTLQAPIDPHVLRQAVRLVASRGA